MRRVVPAGVTGDGRGTGAGTTQDSVQHARRGDADVPAARNSRRVQPLEGVAEPGRRRGVPGGLQRAQDRPGRQIEGAVAGGRGGGWLELLCLVSRLFVEVQSCRLLLRSKKIPHTPCVREHLQ